MGKLFYSYSFSPSSGREELFQGTAAAMRSYAAKTGKIVVRGGHGSYWLKKTAYGEIHEFLDTDDEQIHLRSIRPSKKFMSEHFGKKSILTKPLKEEFFKELIFELNNGKIKFDDLY